MNTIHKKNSKDTEMTKKMFWWLNSCTYGLLVITA